jgi:hypothetical protein
MFPVDDVRRARPSRREFLLRALAVPAAAGLASMACSGAPQAVPPAPSPASDPPPPPREFAPPAPSDAQNASLVAVRSFQLADGIEPALVFRVLGGR